MKKIRSLILVGIVGLIVSRAQAVSVSDIPTMRSISAQLYQDARDLLNLSQQLNDLNDNAFTLSVAGSTQTISLSNAQKSGLIAQYQFLKKKMSDDFANLP